MRVLERGVDFLGDCRDAGEESADSSEPVVRGAIEGDGFDVAPRLAAEGGEERDGARLFVLAHLAVAEVEDGGVGVDVEAFHQRPVLRAVHLGHVDLALQLLRERGPYRRELLAVPARGSERGARVSETRASARAASDATGKSVASGPRAVEGGMLTLAEDTHEHQSAYTSTRVGPLATPASKVSSLSSTTWPSGRSVAIAGAARHTSASVRSVARMAGARASIL